MGMKLIPEIGLIDKSIVGEARQLFGPVRPVNNQMAGHGTAASLGMHGHHLELLAIVYVEERMDDGELSLHPFPVEQMLELFSSQMKEYAVVSLHCADEVLSEQGLPEAEERLAASGR